MRVESGKWRVESGEWKVESGKWKVESGKWKDSGFFRSNLWKSCRNDLTKTGEICYYLSDLLFFYNKKWLVGNPLLLTAN